MSAYADWLESALGDRLDEYRPILAYHLEQAARYRRELIAGRSRACQPSPAGPRSTSREAGAAALDRGDATGCVQSPSASGRAGRDRFGSRCHGACWRARRWSPEPRQRRPTRSLKRRGRLRTRSAIGAPRPQPRRSASTLASRWRRNPARRCEADAERLRQELITMGDQAGADRAALEVAKLRFFSGHAASALELAQELLATASRHGQSPRRAPGMDVRRSPIGVRCRYRKRSSSWMSWRHQFERRSGPRTASRECAARCWPSRGGSTMPVPALEEAKPNRRRARGRLRHLGAPGSLHGPCGAPRGECGACGGARARWLRMDDRHWVRGFRQHRRSAHLARAMLELGRDDEAEHWATVARDMGARGRPGREGTGARGAGACARAARGLRGSRTAGTRGCRIIRRD